MYLDLQHNMAYLKKSDLKNGVIIYRRRKTG